VIAIFYDHNLIN